MDYDGNDFQNPNFQLSGEENNRFPSGLRSYSLPKFDLDDHFQANLRFDSLVESDSLLGIQDQEERSWIEDFSAGNTALDFNSCAGEPCSLSRRRNVWSDATSSESVEILLKSVGEDDVIHKTASFIDVASSDEVIGVDIHMDPSHFQSGSLDSNGAKTIDEDSILLPEKCEIEFDGANLDSAIIDDVSKNPEEVSPPDHCCTSDITTLPREESLVIEERLIDDSSKIGGESVGNSVTEETPNIAVSESDARVSDISVTESDGLMTNRIIEHFEYFSPKNLPAMKPEDLGEQITDEGRGSLNDHSVIPNLDLEINHPSPAMEDFDNRTTSENDGLLEDVAHQIENLGKGNSTLHNEKSPDVHSPESSCLDEAAKIDSICAVNESNSPLESSEPPVLVVIPTTSSFTDSEPVLASEENEITENPLKAEGPHEVSGSEEREDHDLVSGEQGHHPNVSESPGVQKSSEDKVHEEDKVNTSDVEMPDAAKEAENVESLHSEYRSPSEEPIAETSENSALQKPRSNTESVLMSSDDLKSHIVEKPSDSLSQKPDVPAPSETQSLDEEVIPENEENSAKLHSLPEVCNRNPMELVCDSPTKIAPAKPSSAHIANQEADKKILEEHSLSKPPQSSRSKKSSRKSKERAPSEERTFTFEVGSKSASPKSAADGWKPFSVMESFGTPQVDEISASKSESKKANLASPSEARPLAAVTRKKDKSRPSPMGSTGKSSSKKRSTVNETPPLKDAAEKSVGTSSTPSVSASPMQREEKYQYSVNEGSGSTRFQQPFTDAQQVQLRAQIFVYGSLIQGIPPDEACMVSAFGTSVRSSWEGTWRTSLEKFNSQKSPANFPTPLPSLSGARIPEQSARSTIRSRPPVTPVSMTPNKSIGKGSSPVVSNLMPLTSPIWQDISHTSVPRVPHVDPGQIVSPAPVYQLSQSKEYLPGGSSPWVPQIASVPWLGPSQSLVPEKRLHFSASLTSETTPTVVRESTPPRSPNLQLMKTSSLSTPGVPLTSPGSLPGIISPPVEKKSAGTINQKSKKQKKGEGLPRGEQDNSISAPVPTPVPVPSPAPSMPVLPLSSPIPVPPTYSQVIEHKGKEQRPALSEETKSKIGQVELQAEEAAAFAAAAVKHSEGIWSQLPILRSSGLSSTAEAKIASAAAAVAAASSVAKAAAAAAKVAADAAMQAKLMADEAVVDQRSGPGFLLKGKERVSSSTTAVLSTVREMARRRVEATAAASKRAENLDAILKAAELAAVAVCQAGAVVSMGDPLPFTLNDLIEVGPGGYWKAPSTFNFGSDADDNPSALPAIEGRQESVANQTDAEYTEESMPEKANKRSIQEGSLVEVLTDKDNARRVWYSANVLSVKDDKAHVIYNELPHDTGGEKEKEWVALEGEVDQPPRIRMAHPLMSVKYEGTRKRRREAVGNYLWAVGDRVDAFIQNGWCEGVVTEKSKEDETKLTVHFSGGELSVVRAWQLRPSLVWKDGHWVEWSRLRENISYPHEGDTPKDKRQKMGTLEPAEYPKFKSIDLVEEPANLVPEASGLPLLALSEKEKIFSLGKSSSTDSRNPNLPKMKKPGPREGGPRVVFGVPKPGKKRKFMEVSKHYVAGKSGEGVKYLLPMKDAPEPESKVRKALESKPPRHPSQRQNMLTRDRGQNQSEVNREESLSLVVDVSSARHVAATSAGSKKKSKDGARGTASVPERAKSEERQDQAGELRRSSRRIQPTSRLLEGLQSSMVVTKIPSSGDKAARTSSKNKPSPLSKNGAAPVHG